MPCARHLPYGTCISFFTSVFFISDVEGFLRKRRRGRKEAGGWVVVVRPLGHGEACNVLVEFLRSWWLPWTLLCKWDKWLCVEGFSAETHLGLEVNLTLSVSFSGSSLPLNKDLLLLPFDLCLFFFYFLNFYWSIADLQCCISFRYTAKWISYIDTYLLFLFSC